MDCFARLGYDTWCVDMEGYGRSDKRINADIANGADDLAAATDYIRRALGVESFLMYGISSGAAAGGALRRAPPEARPAPRPRRVCVDGAGSPTLATGASACRVPGEDRRPIDQAFVRSIFTRDHPGTATTRRSRRSPTRSWPWTTRCRPETYVDMCRHCARRPGEDHGADDRHARRIRRYRELRGPGRVLHAIAEPGQAVRRHARHRPASLQQKNYRIPLHILHSFFSQPDPVYRGAEGGPIDSYADDCLRRPALVRRPASAQPAPLTPDPVDVAAAKKGGRGHLVTSTPVGNRPEDREPVPGRDRDQWVELFRSGGSAVLRRFMQEDRRAARDRRLMTIPIPAEVLTLIKRDLVVPFRPRNFDKIRDEVKDPKGYHVAQRVNLVGIIARADKSLAMPKNWTRSEPTPVQGAAGDAGSSYHRDPASW